MKAFSNRRFCVEGYLRRSLAIKLLAILMAVFVVEGCFFQRKGMKNELNAYNGDGELELLVRLSDFGRESYGYALALPAFRTDMVAKQIYQLSGLPLWSSAIYVELATFLPIFSMPIAEADRRALYLPAEHQVSCKLIEANSGLVIGKYLGNVQTLEESKTLQFHGASFMKHLFIANLTEIQNTKSLELHVEYDIERKPIEGKLKIILLMDAPYMK